MPEIAHAKDRPAVLTLIGAFWPGNDSSGPNLSYKAMAQALGAEFRFLQVSRDRGVGANEPLVADSSWFDRGFAQVRYCAPTTFGVKDLRDVLTSTSYDCLVLNGFFDKDFTLPSLFMRRFGRVPKKPTILSPRGEFSGGALGLKAGRKGAYLRLARRLNLLGDVVLHATSERELDDIRSIFPWAADYVTAPNVRALMQPKPRIDAPRSPCRVTFIGRISPIKNLDFALHVLTNVGVPIEFTIFGPVQDEAHWRRCQELIAKLPKHIVVSYRGEIANDDMPDVFAATDLFFLPSKSENFGHSIFEALSCGTPVLIGNATPWRNLTSQKAGFDLPLQDPERFARTLECFAAMSDQEHREFRIGARQAAEISVADSEAISRTRQMFERVLSIKANQSRLTTYGSPRSAPFGEA